MRDKTYVVWVSDPRYGQHPCTANMTYDQASQTCGQFMADRSPDEVRHSVIYMVMEASEETSQQA